MVPSNSNVIHSQISESAYQLLREISVLSQEEFYVRFSGLSNETKRQLSLIPSVNTQPLTAQFPWPPSMPTSQTGALISLAPSQSNPIPSPPMEYVVPHLPTPIVTNTTTPVENNRGLDGPNPVRTTTPRRTRRHYEAENSDEDYYPPLQTRARARIFDRVLQVVQSFV